MKKKIILVLVFTPIVFISLLLLAFWKMHAISELTEQSKFKSELTQIQKIPFELIDGHIVVQASINGSKKTFPFGIDSGANSHVFEEHLSIFENEKIGTGFSIDINNNFSFPDILNVRQIGIGGLMFENVAVNESKTPHCSNYIVGIIGANILRHLVWQINFEDKYLLVGKSLKEFEFGESAQFVKAIGKYSKLNIPVTIEGNQENMIVDTGNGGFGSLQNNKNSLGIKLHRMHNIFGETTGGLGGATNNNGYYSDIEDFYIDSTNIHLKDIVLSCGKSMNTLGNKFLSHYVVTLDWPSRTVVFEKNKKGIEPMKTFGFKPKFDEKLQKITVANITEHTPAYWGGLLPNDIIHSINGFSMEKVRDVCFIKNLMNEDQVDLILEKGGSLQPVSLIKSPFQISKPSANAKNTSNINHSK